MWYFIIWILLISFSLYYISSNKEVLAPKYALSLYFIKITFGLAIGFYYFYLKEESGDSFLFFKMALEILEKSGKEIYDFLVFSKTELAIDTPRSTLFLKFLVLIAIVSLKNYWLSCILIASISYLSLFIVFKRYFIYLKKYKPQLILSFFIFPSVLFWTSGIFKESMALIFLLYSLIAVFDYLIERKIHLLSILVSLISFYIFFELRYFLAIFLIPIIGILIGNELPKKKARLFIVMSAIIIAILIMIHPVLNPSDFPQFLYSAHHNILNLSNSGMKLYYNFSEPSWISIISNLPMAFVNAFIRPFPWEWHSLQTFIYAIESYILMGVLISFIFQLKNQKNKSHIFILAFIFSALVLISLATPNFGSLYRYKSICIPFLMFIMIKDLNMWPFGKQKAN